VRIFSGSEEGGRCLAALEVFSKIPAIIAKMIQVQVITTAAKGAGPEYSFTLLLLRYVVEVLNGVPGSQG
jgi:hypothetical protein